jgi:hypothetical protein
METLLAAGEHFRQLDAAELPADVTRVVIYVNGVRQRAEEQRVAA